MKIILIGFMGSGKSTVAPLLAAKLDLEAIEMDDLIVEKSGRDSIVDIFEAGGEASFRQLEAAVAKDIQPLDNVVISTGGGIVTNPAIMADLAANAIVIELSAPFETVLQRISPNLPRPLFSDPAQAKQLYERRKPLYSKYATIHVDTDNRSISDVVQIIITKV